MRFSSEPVFALGTELRGNAIASYVVASATDGYQVVFSLAELDPGFTSNDIIVADTIDGKPLFAYQGPLRIVAPKDARAARSIRHVAAPRSGPTQEVIRP